MGRGCQARASPNLWRSGFCSHTSASDLRPKGSSYLTPVHKTRLLTVIQSRESHFKLQIIHLLFCDTFVFQPCNSFVSRSQRFTPPCHCKAECAAEARRKFCQGRYTTNLKPCLTEALRNERQLTAVCITIGPSGAYYAGGRALEFGDASGLYPSLTKNLNLSRRLPSCDAFGI